MLLFSLLFLISIFSLLFFLSFYLFRYLLFTVTLLTRIFHLNIPPHPFSPFIHALIFNFLIKKKRRKNSVSALSILTWYFMKISPLTSVIYKYQNGEEWSFNESFQRSQNRRKIKLSSGSLNYPPGDAHDATKSLSDSCSWRRNVQE